MHGSEWSSSHTSYSGSCDISHVATGFYIEQLYLVVALNVYDSSAGGNDTAVSYKALNSCSYKGLQSGRFLAE